MLGDQLVVDFSVKERSCRWSLDRFRCVANVARCSVSHITIEDRFVSLWVKDIELQGGSGRVRKGKKKAIGVEVASFFVVAWAVTYYILWVRRLCCNVEIGR